MLIADIGILTQVHMFMVVQMVTDWMNFYSQTPMALYTPTVFYLNHLPLFMNLQLQRHYFLLLYPPPITHRCCIHT